MPELTTIKYSFNDLNDLQYLHPGALIRTNADMAGTISNADMAGTVSSANLDLDGVREIQGIVKSIRFDEGIQRDSFRIILSDWTYYNDGVVGSVGSTWEIRGPNERAYFYLLSDPSSTCKFKEIISLDEFVAIVKENNQPFIII